jgi:hypothetical protein
MAQKGSGGIGQACVVTEGPNKGKAGTYTVDDEGNLWCEGPWGGTQCATRCADSAARAVVYEHVDASDGRVTYEIEGFYEIDGVGVFHCTARIDPASGSSENVTAIPVTAISVTELTKSRSKLDRLTAAAIESHVKTVIGRGG